jgi:hypothetical protein
MLTRIFTAIFTFVLVAVPALAQPPTPAAQEGFVPASSLPQSEQMPAAPLVIASYALFLVAMVFYLWTIWKRIGKVEAEMHELARRQAGGAR